MHTIRLAALWSILASLILALTVAAQQQQQQPVAERPGPMHIPKTAAVINLDGALDDAAWQEAAVIDKFYETSPSDNIPAKINTVAYITYDARYF